MGTTFTGSKIKDTYKALLKFGDNNVISGSLKTISDGLGGDLPMQISSTAISFTGTVGISGATASTIAIFDASKNLISAALATYPSLTELSYVKGVTSNIQTQLNNAFSLPSLTSGSVLFSNGTTIAQDNANFFWDDTNNTLILGGVTSAGTGNKLRIPIAPTASANYGLVSLGSGAFDGATAGFFTGSANGTLIAGNLASGSTSDLLNLQLAGANRFKIASSGDLSAINLTGVSGVYSFSAYYTQMVRLNFNNHIYLTSGGASGRFQLLNASESGFDMLQFGGIAATEPALKRSTTGLIVRLANDSADTWLQTAYTKQAPTANNVVTSNKLLYGATTDAATVVELTSDGAVGSGATNRIAVPNNTSLSIVLNIGVKQSGSANAKQMLRQVVITNNGGTTALSGTPVALGTDTGDAGLTTVACTITANNTDDCLKVEVNGIAATSLRYTCYVVSVETTYA